MNGDRGSREKGNRSGKEEQPFSTYYNDRSTHRTTVGDYRISLESPAPFQAWDTTRDQIIPKSNSFPFFKHFITLRTTIENQQSCAQTESYV